MNQSESIAKLAEALAAAQGEMHAAIRDANNPYFKSRYADLASVWEAIREPLSKHGLSVVQALCCDPALLEYVVLDTRLSHSSGEWLEGRIAIKPVKNDPQAVGSAITYMRRYSLQAIAGVAADDDDGNAASGRGGQPAPKNREVSPPRQVPPKFQQPPKAPAKTEPMGDLPGGFGFPADDGQADRLYLARAGDAGLTSPEVAALAKKIAGKATPDAFTAADREAVMRRLNLASNFLVWARDVCGLRTTEEAKAVAMKCGAMWDQPWGEGVVKRLRTEMGQG